MLVFFVLFSRCLWRAFCTVSFKSAKQIKKKGYYQSINRQIIAKYCEKLIHFLT